MVNEHGEIIKRKRQSRGRKRPTPKIKTGSETLSRPLEGSDQITSSHQSEKRKKVKAEQWVPAKVEQKIEVEYPEVEIDLTIGDSEEDNGVSTTMNEPNPQDEELTSPASSREELIPLEPQVEAREEHVPDQPLHPEDLAAVQAVEMNSDIEYNLHEDEQLESNDKNLVEEELNRLLLAPSEQRRPPPNTPLHQIV